MSIPHDDLTSAELHLYSRQILLDQWDIDAQQQLKHSRVLLIGAGGLGCTVAEILARAGVGVLHIVDFDDIDTSNLQRQIGYELQDVGQPKVDVLCRHLRRINPHIDIQGFNTHFDGNFMRQYNIELRYDLILDGSDNFTTRYAVNAFALSQQTPLLSAAAIGLEGQLLWLEGQPCYACIFGDDQQDIIDDRRCANSGVLASVPIVLASLQAHHALLYLGRGQVPLRQRLLLWDGLTLQQRLIHTQPDTACRYCGRSS